MPTTTKPVKLSPTRAALKGSAKVKLNGSGRKGSLKPAVKKSTPVAAKPAPIAVAPVAPVAPVTPAPVTPAPVKVRAVKKPAPKPVVETVEAAGIATTSELAGKLQALGVTAVLAEPPKVFVAVLSKKGSSKTFSEIFTVQSHGESSCHTVLAKLVSAMTGQKVAKAEHGPSGLEFFLKREFEILDKESSVVPGENIVFNGDKNLGAGVTLQIFRNNPHVIDNDPATLRTNKAIAKEAIEEQLGATDFVGQALESATAATAGKRELLTELTRDL